jgi:predicted nucleic acid-binding protein
LYNSLIVLLDTTVLHRDVHARRWAMSAILEAAAHGDFTVVVPEIVVLEVARHFKERLPAAINDLRGAIKKRKSNLEAFGLDVPEAPELVTSEAFEQYEAELRDRLSESGCRIADTPDVRPAVLGP